MAKKTLRIELTKEEICVAVGDFIGEKFDTTKTTVSYIDNCLILVQSEIEDFV